MARTISEHHAVLVAQTAAYEAKMMQAAARTRAATEKIGTAFEDADKRTASATASMAANASKALGEIGKKFQLGKIGESVLGGVGLGSGFAVAQKAADAIVAHWAEAAEHAKTIADYSDRTTAAVLKQIELRRTPAQSLATDRTKLERMDVATDVAAAKAGSFGATKEDEQRAASMRAETEELRLSVQEREKAQKEEATRRAQDAQNQRNERDRTLAAEIAAIEERRAEEQRTDAERVARLQKEIELRKADTESGLENTLKRMQAEDKLGGLRKKMSDETKAERDKTLSKAQAELEKVEAEEARRREAAAERHRGALDSVFGAETNDYQRRGLQLGPARPDLFSAPAGIFNPRQLPAGSGGPENSSNKNTENLLKQVVTTLQAILRKEPPSLN